MLHRDLLLSGMVINRVGSWCKSLGLSRGVTLVDGDVWGVAGKAG